MKNRPSELEYIYKTYGVPLEVGMTAKVNQAGFDDEYTVAKIILLRTYGVLVQLSDDDGNCITTPKPEKETDAPEGCKIHFSPLTLKII